MTRRYGGHTGPRDPSPTWDRVMPVVAAEAARRTTQPDPEENPMRITATVRVRVEDLTGVEVIDLAVAETTTVGDNPTYAAMESDQAISAAADRLIAAIPRALGLPDHPEGDDPGLHALPAR